MNGTPKFELHGLQNLFATAATATNDPSRLLFDPYVLREYIVGKVARIKHRLLENAITIENEDAARRYVQIHQYSVVAIMDKLFRRSEQPATLECCDELDGLLSFLKQHFPHYFDDLAKAPLKHIHEVRMEIAFSCASLQKSLIAISSLGALPYIILAPLDRFYSRREGQPVSFSRLRHLRHILEHAEKVAHDRHESGDLDAHLINVLFYLNYNSRKTFLQFTQFIRDLLPEEMDRESKFASLSLLLKIATQATVKQNTGYHPNAPTFKSQMIDHLTAELNSLQEDHSSRPIETERELTTWPSVKLNLSVAQLGCLLKLLTDTGLVSTDNISMLMRCLTRHCVTKRSSRISFASLRNRFYEIETGTQQSVQKMLTQLLKSAETISSANSQDPDC